jgi:hypothetical protein
MTRRLRAFARIPPSVLRPFVLQWLLRRTADAFGVPRPTLTWIYGADLLSAYAAFSTARSVFAARRRGDVDAARRALWTSAHRAGTRLRSALGIRTTADAMAAAHAIYRLIGIDLWGSSAGNVSVARCSFAPTYSPEVCSVMSSLDAGLFAGLTGGGRLTFRRRITEGAPACTAILMSPEGVTG